MHAPAEGLEEYFVFSPYSVKRSLYIDGVLYTVSDNTIKSNNLSDLSEVISVSLPYSSIYQ